MRAWLPLALLSACSVPPPPPERPPEPTVSREEVTQVLSALERTFYVHWGAVEGTAEYRKLGAAHVPFLRDIADANGELSLVAYRVLRRLAPEQTFSESYRAILYASAFQREENFLRWGLLSTKGVFPAVYGDEMMALKEAVVPYLRKSLSDRRPARVQGLAEAERANRRQSDRVCDYAWIFLCTLLGRSFTYDETPRERDPQLREFDLWLDRRR